VYLGLLALQLVVDTEWVGPGQDRITQPQAEDLVAVVDTVSPAGDQVLQGKDMQAVVAQVQHRTLQEVVVVLVV
jgi:hypothetical protein